LFLQYGLEYKEFLGTLNKEYLYTFFLKNYERNRVVCLTGPYPDAYFTGAFNLYTGIDMKVHMLVRQLPQLYTTYGDHGLYPKNVACGNKWLLKKVKQTDPLWSQGLFIRTPTRGIKIYSHEYTKLAAIRGTDECIARRYIAIKFQKCDDLLDKFIDLYPEHHVLFEDIETRLKALINTITSMYMQKYEDASEFRSDNIGNEICERLLCSLRRKVIMDSLTQSELRNAIGREISLLRLEYLYKIL
jgi:hypothetical protein